MKVIVWVVYYFTFILLVSSLLLHAFFVVAGYTLFSSATLHPGVLQMGNWTLVTLVFVVACFIASWIGVGSRIRWIITLIYSIGIIVMTIIIPVVFLHIQEVGLFYSLYTPIPWFIVWLSIAMMCIFVAKGQTVPLTVKSKHANRNRRRKARN